MTTNARRRPKRSAASTTARRRRLRVALVADTHGVIDARVLDVVRACDLVVHAGDLGSGKVLSAIRRAAGEVCAVRGNNDTPAKWSRREHAALRRLPQQAQLSLPGGVLVVLHGERVQPAARRHEKLRRLYPGVRAVVYGHSHRLVCDRDAVPWVLNPGAAGRARTHGGPSCLTLEASAHGWRVRAHRFA